MVQVHFKAELECTYRRETHVWRSPLRKHGSIAARLPHNGAAAHPNMFGLGWQYGQHSISGRRLLEELPADQDAPDLCGGRGSIASA